MKNIIKIILIIPILIISCNSMKFDESKVYQYNSDTYNDRKKEFSIPIEKAYEIMRKNLDNNNINNYTLIVTFLYDNNYIFSNSWIVNNKTHSYNLSGYWFNANTGEIKHVKSDLIINLKEHEIIKNSYYSPELKEKFNNLKKDSL